MGGEFSLEGFVAHMAGMAASVDAHIEHDLEHAAQVIEAEAKSSLGEYQAAAGPFAAWAELADATKDDRVRQGFPENEPELRTGELRDSYEHTVSGHEAEIGSNSEVAEWQELGTSKMPPRSILGSAAVRRTPDVLRILGEGYVAALVGEQVHLGRIEIAD